MPIPLSRFVCVTGVSGSGKSSLVVDIVARALARELNGAEVETPGNHRRIEGLTHLDKMIEIDQSPIGRTPRSNPATYIKVFDEIRDLFTRVPEARVRGYRPGRFSFNVPAGPAGGGRCEACSGNGSNRIEMDFLADVWVTCPVCNGRRFDPETLQVRFKGQGISDVLDMDVASARAHFESVPKIASMLQTLLDVGLDYLKLGQSSTTLSGGEAQRIKLARELVKRSTGRSLYILDEPTTGLHAADVKKLLAVLHGFVDAGNSVLVVEHHLDVVKTADWVIDLGPEGGAEGGLVVVAGTPEDLARCPESHTGRALRDVLRDRRPVLRASTPRTRTLNRGPARRRREVMSVIGAREHNLQDVTVDVPRNRITVCTGPSGSGKSSFAVDTVYAEGQRRYVESLSAYARQFISRLQPPRVEAVHGLSPAVCIEQRTTSRSPRSTVGTITEIYDYLRVLWARFGTPYCPDCRGAIRSYTSGEIVDRLLESCRGRSILLLAPVSNADQVLDSSFLERLAADGFHRIRLDGHVHRLDATTPSALSVSGRLEVVVDRLRVRSDRRGRLHDGVEQALLVGAGSMVAVVEADQERSEGANQAERPVETDGPGTFSSEAVETEGRGVSTGRKTIASAPEFHFSRRLTCPRCQRSFEALNPHHFSFNTRLGWCESCEGLGTQAGASPSTIIVHPTRSLLDGAVAGWGSVPPRGPLRDLVCSLADYLGFDPHHPWNGLTDRQQLAVLHGTGDRDWIPWRSSPGETGRSSSGPMRFRWRGFFPAIARAVRSSPRYRKQLDSLATEVPCAACAGGRLRPEPAAVRLGETTIHEVCRWPLARALAWFRQRTAETRDQNMAGELLSQMTIRLGFLVNVGLDYLSLDRAASTLSGGESQRIHLASQLGTGLTGVLYVLDEPTIGLHPRDTGRLVSTLKKLRDLGNSLLMVEHDREVIDSADHVLDFGPGAGRFGGRVTAAAAPGDLVRRRGSLTGRYLSGKEAIPVPTNRRPVARGPRDSAIQPERFEKTGSRSRLKASARSGTIRDSTPVQKWLTVRGAYEHNLKEIDASFPLSRFTCVTGVSGSGKSTLVSDVLYPAVATRLHAARLLSGGHHEIVGVEHIDKVINVDQAPIGNAPTSNPATYTGVFDPIRELFARLPLSRMRGYSANRFSFNRPGGRCESCEGMGQRCIEMHFLPDVWIECENCRGARYVPETLEVRYRGHSIADVLAMSISAAADLFETVPRIHRLLKTLDDVGLGYVSLGQSAPTLSGGEAQRVKLAAELGRASTGRTLYILDEPTTGLHFDDLRKLLAVIQRLVDLGNTCLCIEHNLEVIKSADWVIDLGPEAAHDGGRIVAEGTPEEIAACSASHTGRALRPILAAGPHLEREGYRPEERIRRSAKVPSGSRMNQGDSAVATPWERDGRAWHTECRGEPWGKPAVWDRPLLVWLVETIESAGKFSPTDWCHRTRIEIQASGKRSWFCHLLTGGRDLIEGAFRVPAGTFDERTLPDRLAIPTLDERVDLTIYGSWSRVRVRTPSPGWQEVRLFLRDFKDVSRSVVRSFIREAARAYLACPVQDASVAASALGVSLPSIPWMEDGRQWHLSQRSLRPGQVARWKPEALLSVIGRLRSANSRLIVNWNHPGLVALEEPGAPLPAARIITRLGRGLFVELRLPPGSGSAPQVEGFGDAARIRRRAKHDWIVVPLLNASQLNVSQVRALWSVVDDTGGRKGKRYA